MAKKARKKARRKFVFSSDYKLKSMEEMPKRRLELKYVPVSKLKLWDKNPRVNDAAALELSRLVREHGFIDPVIATFDNVVRAGNTRLKTARKMGLEEIPVIYVDFPDEEAAEMYSLGDNKASEFSYWRKDMLASLLNQRKRLPADTIAKKTGFPRAMIATLRDPDAIPKTPGALAEDFIVTPLSVLNARDGKWLERKRAWLSLEIQSEAGRDPALLEFSPSSRGMMRERLRTPKKRPAGAFSRGASANSAAGNMPHPPGLIPKHTEIWHGGGTSIFDPCLCELMYRWFCPKDGLILDPFSGGSVRGIVAAWLGYRYIGVDISKRQIEANRSQAAYVLRGKKDAPKPKWIIGNSLDVWKKLPHQHADFIFSSPPYPYIEHYSDRKGDLADMEYDKFRNDYDLIVRRVCRHLRPDRFACFVVGDGRDPKTRGYVNFVGHTSDAFLSAGLIYANEIIYITPMGSLVVRTRRPFEARRIVGKTHQNVLVYARGSLKEATAACEPVITENGVPRPKARRKKI